VENILPQRLGRLRGKSDFERVFAKGRRIQHPLATLLLLACEAEITRAGFVVSRKFGGAVKRNRVRRRLREAVRLLFAQAHIAGAWDMIFIPRSRLADADFKSIRAAVEALLIRAEVLES